MVLDRVAHMNVTDLPPLNATLNGLAADPPRWRATRASGWAAGSAHRACMLSAFAVSALFLVSYVVYHASAGSKHFSGTGVARAVYFGILITHVVLAAIILPMAIVTLSRALRGRFERHVRIARWTLPIWLYVSVTGVTVYWMLYRLH